LFLTDIHSCELNLLKSIFEITRKNRSNEEIDSESVQASATRAWSPFLPDNSQEIHETFLREYDQMFPPSIESPRTIVFGLLFAIGYHKSFLSFQLLSKRPPLEFRGIVNSHIFSLSRSCIRSFINRALSVGHRESIEGLVAIHGRVVGAFGNNFIELINMLQFAIVCGIKEIFLDQNFLLLEVGTTLTTLQNIRITVVDSSSGIPYSPEKWIGGDWFHVACHCPDVTWRYAADSIRPALLPTLPCIPSDRETLFLYGLGRSEL
jgi:hypothetical protein